MTFVSPNRPSREREALLFVPGPAPDASFVRADREVREAELRRDAARLLDGQAIGIDPGQRANERRLAVIDVPGSAEDCGDGPCTRCEDLSLFRLL